MKILNRSLAALILSATCSQASAAIVAAWDMAGQPGDQAAMNASTTAAGIDGGELARGPGLNAPSGSDSFSSSGWSGTDPDDYISLTLKIADGYQLQLDSAVLNTRSSNTGPGTLGLFSSLDGFSTLLGSSTQSGGDVIASSFDLSALGTITGSLELRLIELGNTQADGSGDTTSSGTLRLLNGDTGLSRLEGEVQLSPVPLPASAWLFGSALAALGARRRLAGTSPQ